MNTPTKVALAVGSGYLLGRTKKLKLAITVGTMLAGKRITTNPRALLQQSLDYIERTPELARLSDQVRGELYGAARSAAVAAASSRMDRFSDALSDRALSLGSRSDAEEDEEEGDDSETEEETSSRSPSRSKGSSSSGGSERSKSGSGTKKKTTRKKASSSSGSSGSGR